ncbi:SDR family NAD(P)-dependent oxidoreductase [Sulfitobacter albidus]|uniref:SDR family NAD(P)-dependent oxidoreductase n=1 Tax=Sulfitobacter albidus TaxID=2829501 RepID=A0A975PNI4_9RHOB|nr:SDR family NAD(P)-dependent oxidoreductase [Sulfitobacter albidus]QUJ77883.1 SDR family NAD(P)-dependent oxidoreductase [Sulfitobacter albidus]
MTQTTLITGASRGLGAALAEALAPAHHIIAVGRTVGALEELDDRIKAKGGEATLAPMNVTDAGAMQTLCRGIFDRWGSLDLWIHCAVHAAPMTPTPHVDERDFAKSLDSNVTATARLITYVAPLLGTEGRAVFFDDPQAGQKFFASYGASKSAQMALARSWQAESARTGPRIDIATPVPMPTATRARFYPGEDRARLTDCHTEAARIIAELGL